MVSITLQAADGGPIRLVHSGVPDDDFGRLAENGWKMVSNAIAADLERDA